VRHRAGTAALVSRETTAGEALARRRLPRCSASGHGTFHVKHRNRARTDMGAPAVEFQPSNALPCAVYTTCCQAQPCILCRALQSNNHAGFSVRAMSHFRGSWINGHSGRHVSRWQATELSVRTFLDREDLPLQSPFCALPVFGQAAVQSQIGALGQALQQPDMEAGRLPWQGRPERQVSPRLVQFRTSGLARRSCAGACPTGPWDL